MLDANPEKTRPENSEPVQCVFYTVAETALLLGVAPSTVYDYHHEGTLTIKKIGKLSKILKSEVDQFIKDADMPRGVDRSRAVGKYHPNKKMKPAPHADKPAEVA